MRWSRLSSLLWRLLDQVVDPRLTEIHVEVAGIALGGGTACPFRVGGPLHGGGGGFASSCLVIDAPSILCLCLFRGRLCSLPGLRTPLAVVVLRTGPGRGLARLAVIVLRTGPGRGLARLAVVVPRPGPRLAVVLVPRLGPSPGFVAPTHAFGW